MIDWNQGTFKLEYSDQFERWGVGAVNIYSKHKRLLGVWNLAMLDMSPRVLRWIKLPSKIVEAAELVTRDEKTRLVSLTGEVGNGTIRTMPRRIEIKSVPQRIRIDP